MEAASLDTAGSAPSLDTAGCPQGWARDSWFLLGNLTGERDECGTPVGAFLGVVATLGALQLVALVLLGVAVCGTKRPLPRALLAALMVHGAVGAAFLLRSIAPRARGPAWNAQARPDFWAAYAVWMATLLGCALGQAVLLTRLSLQSIPRVVQDDSGNEVRSRRVRDDRGLVGAAALVAAGLLLTLGAWGAGINLSGPEQGRLWFQGFCWACAELFWWFLGCLGVAASLVGLILMSWSHLSKLAGFIDASAAHVTQLNQHSGSQGSEAAAALREAASKMRAGKRIVLFSGTGAALVWALQAVNILPMYWWLAAAHFANSLAFQAYEIYVFTPRGMRRCLGRCLGRPSPSDSLAGSATATLAPAKSELGQPPGSATEAV